MSYKFNPFTGTLDIVGAGGVIPPGSVTGIEIPFIVTDWITVGTNWALDLQHNLGTFAPVFDIYEGTSPVQMSTFTVINNSIVRVLMPKDTNNRFIGTAVFVKV